MCFLEQLFTSSFVEIVLASILLLRTKLGWDSLMIDELIFCNLLVETIAIILHKVQQAMNLYSLMVEAFGVFGTKVEEVQLFPLF